MVRKIKRTIFLEIEGDIKFSVQCPRMVLLEHSHTCIDSGRFEWLWLYNLQSLESLLFGLLEKKKCQLTCTELNRSAPHPKFMSTWTMWMWPYLLQGVYRRDPVSTGSYQSRVSPKPNMTAVLIRRTFGHRDTNTQGTMPCEDRGRDCSNVPMSRGFPAPTKS